MKTVNVHEAKTHLSRLLAEVDAGEEIVIARAGKPVARLVKIAPRAKRVFGQDAGKVDLKKLDDAFSEEADAEIAQLFHDSILEPK